ncbi:hypothetical protein N9930_00805, partial [bacterium]|nr:hypothetical protein [bacterium]
QLLTTSPKQSVVRTRKRSEGHREKEKPLSRADSSPLGAKGTASFDEILTNFFHHHFAARSRAEGLRNPAPFS